MVTELCLGAALTGSLFPGSEVVLEGLMKKVYVDNSSTSFPKAPGVSDVIKNYLDNSGYNIGRGGYAGSYEVAFEALEARRLLAEMFNASPQEVIFTPGITYSLNILLHGLLRQGDHVITSSMEHNAVMRPLHELSKKGVVYDTVRCELDGSLEAEKIIPYVKKETKAIVLLHASNVCGTVMPIKDVAEMAKKHNLKLVVDAAQTAGVLSIDASYVDALAFAGHKGLLGPQGIGGFVIKKDFADEISPLILGGTGSQSDSSEQPNFMPDKYESGTLNIPGIMGLKKAIEYINSVGVKTIFEKEMALTFEFILRISEIDGVRLIGKKERANRVGVVSLDFLDMDNAKVSAMLDEKYGIMTRCGLHCAPMAHRTLETFPHGTVRFSFGYFNTMDEVEYIVHSIKEVQKFYHKL